MLLLVGCFVAGIHLKGQLEAASPNNVATSWVPCGWYHHLEYIAPSFQLSALTKECTTTLDTFGLRIGQLSWDWFAGAL